MQQNQRHVNVLFFHLVAYKKLQAKYKSTLKPE